ncbi:D-alanine--D-alanine ligase family protein [Desulfovibrio ferrophilus]|uniref:D-alanine--D-alanine ligase n=1 Tax=Desulfovibrio ferrophilus TaxID=241368 RepID=A0A2Z6AXZ5_9BACT|nr:ATP-grasp domain-containing protein [Desulfovibrio ferrophilus]BBD08088.1 D-alanine--D-alanine ligase [Desulfovibrio ferrophilus]
MKIVMLYDAPLAGASADNLDVLLQVRCLADELRARGHVVHSVCFSLDMNAVASSLRGLAPDLVFNLVEGVQGKGRYIHLAPSLLEDMGLVFTGSGSSAMALSSNKLFAKVVMRAAGIPTPPWCVANDSSKVRYSESRRYLIKSVWEHASLGLEDDCLVDARSSSELVDPMRRLRARMGGDCFAERYVEGREFNVAILDSPEGLIVLPLAEILFETLPPGATPIVGYQAKWDEDSVQYQGTVRSFELQDAKLEEALKRQTLECWKAFGLSGYARVDYRVDEGGGPQVIDVNANPCLSPDAGFQAALKQAGISFGTAVECIVDAAFSRVGVAPQGLVA